MRRFVKPGAALLLAATALSSAACGPRLDDKIGRFAQPNGITVATTGVYRMSWSKPELSRLEADCTRTALARFEKSGLDGLVRMRHGDFLASIWPGRRVHRVNAANEVSGFFEHRALPGIGSGATRDRLHIPFHEFGEVGFRDKTR